METLLFCLIILVLFVGVAFLVGKFLKTNDERAQEAIDQMAKEDAEKKPDILGLQAQLAADQLAKDVEKDLFAPAPVLKDDDQELKDLIKEVEDEISKLQAQDPEFWNIYKSSSTYPGEYTFIGTVEKKTTKKKAKTKRKTAKKPAKRKATKKAKK